MRLRTGPGDLPSSSGTPKAGGDCVRLVESGVEDQTDENVRPPPSGLVRAGSAQDVHYLYASMAECTVRDAPIARVRIDNALKMARRGVMMNVPLTGRRGVSASVSLGRRPAFPTTVRWRSRLWWRFDYGVCLRTPCKTKRSVENPYTSSAITYNVIREGSRSSSMASPREGFAVLLLEPSRLFP